MSELEHKGQHGSEEGFLEEVTPKLSSQIEYWEAIVGNENMSRAPRQVVGEQPVDEQRQT